jgi:hypothetical protein
MKHLSLYQSLSFIGKIILPGLIAVPAFAHHAEKISGLQRVIAMQQKQMEMQQKRSTTAIQ